MSAFSENTSPVHSSRSSRHTNKPKQRNGWRLSTVRILLGLLVLWLIAVMVYQTNKPLPAGVSYESPVYSVDHVNFYYDLTYPAAGSGDRFTQKRHIYDRVLKMIDEANQYVVIDMFLFNNYVHNGQKYPSLSEGLANKLIQRKQEKPDMQMVFITDEVNTDYNSTPNPLLEQLKQAGISVVMTDVDPLRDSTPVYSAVWRTFFQWFGQAGKGTIPNAMATSGPDMTFRSYLKLMNVKANHRKAIITDNSAMVSTGNIHDASAYNSNVAFEVQGPIIGELLKAEQAVVNLSGSTITLPTYDDSTATADNQGTGDTVDPASASSVSASSTATAQTASTSSNTTNTVHTASSGSSNAASGSTNGSSTGQNGSTLDPSTGGSGDTSDGGSITSTDSTGSGPIQLRYMTEGKVYDRLLEAIRSTEKGDTLWMGMFYLADKQVTSELLSASQRGVNIQLILDPNQNAFGQDKIGIPNRPVAAELNDESGGKIGIRWYNTTDEQYHTKLMYIDSANSDDLIIGGSSNFTPRNLKDYNLENDFWISAPGDEPLMREVNSYFNMLWNNDGEQYTVPLSDYQEDTTWLKDIAYRLQLILGFTTF
ncbi:phospholipase D family protein [Paenibacillus sp. WLX2291]|uniref:phospholipase D family protein n=1 Tax=Paenibacillus sp. WLX2291 TaxID=3296934 RepID=UPI00398412ED